MQLFITNQFSIENENITIKSERIIHQLSKVLRSKNWDIFYIQSNYTRYQISIKNIQKNNLTGLIIWEESLSIDWEYSKNITSMFVALPNNHKKTELIVQKLSEIWINNIYFRQAERSILKEISQKKIERLNTISLEAVEQSRWNYLPNIKVFTRKGVKGFIDKELKTSNSDKKETEPYEKNFFIFFDKENKEAINIPTKNTENNIYWIIWPEWWLTKNDYKLFKNIINTKSIFSKSLWDTILRTETASIIWWWYLKNSL